MDETVFEIIAQIRPSNKMTNNDQFDLLKKLAQLDPKAISIDRVFTGTVMTDDMERLVSLKVKAETPEAAVRHVHQNYCLLLAHFYYNPSAEPTEKRHLPQ